MTAQSQHFALIDASCGFVWWVGEAASPEEACKQADMDTNNGECRGEYRRIPPQSGQDGYVVYEASWPDFNVNDGQDKDAIDAVTSMHCLGLYVPCGE